MLQEQSGSGLFTVMALQLSSRYRRQFHLFLWCSASKPLQKGTRRLLTRTTRPLHTSHRQKSQSFHCLRSFLPVHLHHWSRLVASWRARGPTSAPLILGGSGCLCPTIVAISFARTPSERPPATREFLRLILHLLRRMQVETFRSLGQFGVC